MEIGGPKCQTQERCLAALLFPIATIFAMVELESGLEEVLTHHATLLERQEKAEQALSNATEPSPSPQTLPQQKVHLTT